MRFLLALFLLLALPLGGCKESPGFVKSGPLFAAVEKAPPGKALVYVYWPREEQGRRKRIWITCAGAYEEILPGGFTTFTVEPGHGRLKAEAQWDFRFSDGSAYEQLASVDVDTAAGQTYFVRIEQESSLFTSRVHLRPMQLAAAGPEIGRCRRSVPRSPEEMYQEFAQEQR